MDGCGPSTLSEEQGVTLDPFVREYCRDPPRSVGIALTVNPVFTEELVHLLEEVGLIQPSPRRSRVAACAPAFEAAFVQSGRPLAL